MRHISIPIEQSCEFLDIVPINPLISKCNIKVLYVDDENPNRNKSLITKEAATKLAASLPGCPIVGKFNEGIGDFEEHEEILTKRDGRWVLSTNTVPYGFVDLHAKVWFQKFEDDHQIIREYLCTEGYIWTGQYPESKVIVDEGRGQSMEFDEDFLDFSWAKTDKGKRKFFIVNDGIISKLCVLGEHKEPCFEGASIQVNFSLEDSFKTTFSAMISEMQELLEGGQKQSMDILKYEVAQDSALFTTFSEQIVETAQVLGFFSEGEQHFAIIEDGDSHLRVNFSYDNEELVCESELVEVEKTFIEENGGVQFFAKKEDKTEQDDKDEKEDKIEDKPEEKEDKEDKPEEEQKEEKEEDDDEDKKKTSYSVEEYEALQSELSELRTQFSALEETNLSLQEEISVLSKFKADIELQEKQNMIKTFSMLSDDDKKEVVDNIEKYSLDEIEAKLSILCVRNKVNFNLADDGEDRGMSLNIDSAQGSFDSAPAWVRAAEEVRKQQL